MPSPRIAQRCAKFHRALVTWERGFFLTRCAAVRTAARARRTPNPSILCARTHRAIGCESE
jgi:hypothetical protein